MRLCFLASTDSSHMQKWSRYFLGHNHDVHFITFGEGIIEGATCHRIVTGADSRSSDFQKLRYLTHAKQARKQLTSIQPDIVNAHYASSYGTLAALACEGPYLLSVWGSDIYDFPTKSFLHKRMLEFSLRNASRLLSTSKAMADEAGKYTDRPFDITPFGVDVDLFKPRPRNHGDAFVLAIVKTLSPKYGIDVLLKAVADVFERRPDIPVRLRIAGSGPDEAILKALAHNLGLDDVVEWLGYISQEDAALVWADADVGIVPSSSESFGVAAVEAQACGTPVVVADTPGLMEATLPNESSLVFPKGDYVSLASRIVQLYGDKGLRQRLAACGVKNARTQFSYEKCFGNIERLFSESPRYGSVGA